MVGSIPFFSSVGFVGGIPGASAAPFVGLLDVLGVSATRAYSTRRLASAYVGSAIRIRRSSDNAELNIGFSGENLDTAAITTFVGVNSAYVVTMYDQSGTGDNATQATAASQPRIVNAGTLEVRNTKAAPYFDGTNDALAASVATILRSASAVTAINLANQANFDGLYSQITSAGYAFVTNAPGDPTWAVGGGMGIPSTNGGGNTIIYSGVLQQVRVTNATGTAAADAWVVGKLGTILPWTGWIGEVVGFATQLSAPNYAALYTNQKAYWGTP